MRSGGFGARQLALTVEVALKKLFGCPRRMVQREALGLGVGEIRVHERAREQGPGPDAVVLADEPPGGVQLQVHAGEGGRAGGAGLGLEVGVGLAGRGLLVGLACGGIEDIAARGRIDRRARGRAVADLDGGGAVIVQDAGDILGGIAPRAAAGKRAGRAAGGPGGGRTGRRAGGGRDGWEYLAWG